MGPRLCTATWPFLGERCRLSNKEKAAPAEIPRDATHTGVLLKQHSRLGFPF